VSAQSLPTLPDSAYVKNEIVIWFQDGMLNPDYLGCYNPGVTSKSTTSDESLPFTPDFFYCSDMLSLLLSLGAEEAMKMIPGINPCADTISTAKNGSVMWMPHFWNALVIRFSQDQNIPLLAYNLLVFYNSSVLWAQPNFLYESLGGEGSDFFPKSSPPLLVGFPDDSLWGRNSGLHRSIPGCSYVDTAWTIERGDSAIRVGVCDGGFNALHPDLGGLPLGQNPRFRDGWNYKGLGQNIEPTSQSEAHGTLVAGVLGATSNNWIGIPGIAGGDSLRQPGVSLYGLVANDTKSMAAAIWEGAARSGTTPPTLPGAGQRWECDILNFCVNSRMLFLDMTGVGGAADEILRAMMAFSYQNGVASFAAMGDNANIREHLMEGHDSVFCMYPQDVDPEWVVSVGNNPIQQIDNPYFDWGKNLDILAPAGGWTTSFTVPNGPYGYTTLSSTSGATPVVSGVAGLLLSLHKRMYPQRNASGYDSIPRVLYPDDIEWLLKHSAQPADTLHPHDYHTGWGVINATSTLRKLNYPFVLRHFSGPYTGAVIDTGDFDTLSIVFPGWNPQASYDPLLNGDNTYRVKRYHLIQRVEYGEVFPRVERAWGRGGNELTGYGWPIKLRKSPFRIPLYRVGYCALAEEDAFDSAGCVLETNVYEAWKIDLIHGTSPQYAGWLPCEPSQVVLTGSVLARIDPTVTGIDRIPLPASIHVTGPYPNPTTGAAYIVVSVPNGTRACLNVFDVLGRQLAPNTVMRQYDAGEHIVEIPIGCNGTIFVQVITPEGSTVLKKLNIVR
jgi:subtilisin family serine protease